MLILPLNSYNIKTFTLSDPVEKGEVEARKQATKNNEQINLNNIPNAQYSKISFTGINAIERVSKTNNRKIENYYGCIIGGAIGDALGSPIEFLNMEQIKRFYGKNGIKNLQNGEYGQAEVSDDTQMLFFTADGLIKSIGEKFKSNEIPDMNVVYNSYLDWLETQEKSYVKKKQSKGWISQIPALYERRAPGDTCIGALSSGKMGSITKPINNSKGNGGVMRVAPAGLLYYNNPKIAFEVGARCAAITHGHPSGYLSAGVLASVLAYITKGESLENAIDKSINILEKYKNHEEVKEAILKAKKLAGSNLSPAKAIQHIGGGWVGEEAVAIAIYCALKFPDNFEKAVKTAVNHGGDSDSTGAIAGNIMGLYLGDSAIPEKWKNNIELKKELKTLASDLYYAPFRIQKIRHRYPYHTGRIPNWYESFQTPRSSSKRLQYVKFSPKDEARMRSMSAKDLIEYKRYLIKNKLYDIEKTN